MKHILFTTFTLLGFIAQAQETRRYYNLPEAIQFHQIPPEIRVVNGEAFNLAFLKYWTSRGRNRAHYGLPQERPLPEWEWLEGDITKTLSDSVVVQKTVTRSIRSGGYRGIVVGKETEKYPPFVIRHHPWIKQGTFGENVTCYAMRIGEIEVAGQRLKLYDFGVKKEAAPKPAKKDKDSEEK